MRLGTRPEPTPPADLAEALRRGAAGLGHRPAVTVLHPGVRYEQSGASLANWAAKGAHLLALDHHLGPGDTVGLSAPACWTTASVTLAAWWLGAVVRLDAPAAPGTDVVDGPDEVGAAPVDAGRAGTAAEVAVHVRHSAPGGRGDAPLDPSLAHAEAVLVVGDGIDGGPTTPSEVPVWTREAQPMPDAPPASAAEGERLALVRGASRLTQREVLALAASLGGSSGVLGVETDRVDPVLALVAAAVRPWIVGQATVLLRSGVERDTATAERVSAWCEGAGNG
ncbi:MAG: hypothetical protein ACLFV0_03340 [Nitriliruptoraceae bacterium]